MGTAYLTSVFMDSYKQPNSNWSLPQLIFSARRKVSGIHTHCKRQKKTGKSRYVLQFDKYVVHLQQ